MKEINYTAPTMLLNEQICRNNIQRMAQKAAKHDLKFKPHMKTHQSGEIGQWLREYGVEAVTVSSVRMARFFSGYGWKDITIAFPCNLLEINHIKSLAADVSLTLLVNKPATAKVLQEELNYPVNTYIELDTGSGRTGLLPSRVKEIHELISFFSDSDMLQWKGFYSHPGHSYEARSEDDIQSVQQSVIQKITSLRGELGSTRDDFEVCIGDTPTCSKGTDFSGIDAISPGNFVFYDVMQVQIGSCGVSDVAVAVNCPVVDRYPDRGQLAVYGGAIHFSKESLTQDGSRHYGLVATPGSKGWTIADRDSYLAGISQEHGIVQCSPNVFEQYAIGDTITILPVHSCLTAHLLGGYRLTESGRKVNHL